MPSVHGVRGPVSGPVGGRTRGHCPPVTRRTRRSREALRAASGSALVCRNLSACTYTSDAGLRMMSASLSDYRNSAGPSKSRIRTRTDPSP